jgi:hypothetical protein
MFESRKDYLPLHNGVTPLAYRYAASFNCLRIICAADARFRNCLSHENVSQLACKAGKHKDKFSIFMLRTTYDTIAFMRAKAHCS